VDPIDAIKQLYFNATRQTISRDLSRAVEILKTLPTEEDRERAAVYMDGLAQMRSEWKVSGGRNESGVSRERPRRSRG
jgi:hypothetical protein